MKLKDFCLSIIPPLFFYWTGLGSTAKADVYIYKDSGGRTVITDSPPEHVTIMDTIRDKGVTSSRSSRPTDTATDGTQKHQPKSDTGEASHNSPAVKASIQQGPGFFIHKNGYIVTHSHPLRAGLTGMNNPQGDIARAEGKIDGEPAQKEQAQVQHQTAAKPPVIIKAHSTAFRYSKEVIRVPADIEGRWME